MRVSPPCGLLRPRLFTVETESPKVDFPRRHSPKVTGQDSKLADGKPEVMA